MIKNVSWFKRFMSFTKNHKLGFILSIILAIISVASGLVPYFASAEMIIHLIDGDKNFQFYLLYCGISAISLILKSITASLSTSTSHKSTFEVLSEVRRCIVNKYARVPMGYIIETPSGKLKSNIVERVEQLEVPLAHVIPEMTSNVLVPIGILIYLFIIDWRMALSSLILLPIVLLCYLFMMKGYSKNYSEVLKAGKHMNATTVEYINGIEVIKAFNQTKSSDAKFKDAVHNNTNLILNWMNSTIWHTAIMLSLMPAVLIGVLPIGICLFMEGSLSASVFITSILLSLGIMTPLASAVFFTDDISKIKTVMEEVGKILDEKELIRPTGKQDFSNYDIELKNVKFSYGEKPVLKGVNLEVKQNTVTALVGSSGSGKSTIAKLIASLWDTTEGVITIGGKKINNISSDDLADLISYVSQDNYLFNDTVYNNIRMGMKDATNEQIVKVAKASGCHDFIMGLENGYDTICGDAGSHLSGGERQRITIARAMMKNSPIVIMDEATSYTDPENEEIIQESLKNLTKGKTLIVIAHRLSTITDADQIAVVDDGKIIASDTHNELLEKCPKYRRMWQAHISAKENTEVQL